MADIPHGRHAKDGNLVSFEYKVEKEGNKYRYFCEEVYKREFSEREWAALKQAEQGQIDSLRNVDNSQAIAEKEAHLKKMKDAERPIRIAEHLETNPE